jgi:hypothetical protein
MWGKLKVKYGTPAVAEALGLESPSKAAAPAAAPPASAIMGLSAPKPGGAAKPTTKPSAEPSAEPAKAVETKAVAAAAATPLTGVAAAVAALQPKVTSDPSAGGLFGKPNSPGPRGPTSLTMGGLFGAGIPAATGAPAFSFGAKVPAPVSAGAPAEAKPAAFAFASPVKQAPAETKPAAFAFASPVKQADAKTTPFG